MTKQTLPDRSLDWAIPYDPAVVLIARSEGCRLTAYRCPAGVLTIGWGETEGGVYEGERITQREADDMLCLAIKRYAAKVRALCTAETNENELGALTSLGYNIGLGALAKSTVLRAHNKGDKAAAARAFGLFNTAKVNGVRQVLKGLTARRAAEAALYLKPASHDDEDHVPEAMPQAVAPESKLSASPIAQAGTATTLTGAATLLSTVKDNADSAGATVSTLGSLAATVKGAVQSVADFVGVSPVALAGLVLVAAGIAVMVYRHKQRTDGWA